MYMVNILMVEAETGGFDTGISRSGMFTSDEIVDQKYLELIKDIPLLEGCEWSYNINEIDQGKMDEKLIKTAHPILPDSIELIVNGVKQKIGSDFNISEGNTIHLMKPTPIILEGWISVEDRPPPQGQPVFGIDDECEGVPYTFIHFHGFAGDIFVKYESRGQKAKPTHWLPFTVKMPEK